MSFAVIGKRLPRVDSREQVTGRLQYTNDIQVPGMLYAKGLFSTEDHAKIVELDTSNAEKLPGVKAVITHKDVPSNKIKFIIPDQPALVVDKVRYRGEIIAAVAAETEEIAAEAIELIKIKYERLPAVFDPKDAMKPDSPIVHEDKQGIFCKGNIILDHAKHEYAHLRHGNIEEGFAQSDLIVEHSFATTPQRNMPIEPHACLAKPDGPDRITIIGNSQMPHNHQGQICKILQLPLNRVRVSSAAVGGAFGQKNIVTLEPLVALLALKADRPVSWVLSTAEDMGYAAHKLPIYHHYKIGVKADGTLMAVDRSHICNTGAYASSGILISHKTALLGAGPYRVPYHQSKTWLVYTNKCPSGAFRGFGMSQPTFAMESMMDIIAEKLIMDPIEFRLKNVLVDGDSTATGQVVRAVGITDILVKLRDESGWGK